MGSRIHTQLIEALVVMEAAATPANPDYILKQLARLMLHFPSISHSENEMKELLRDYFSDLAEYPQDLIEMACTHYRRSRDSRYFPKVGQLLCLMQDRWSMRKWRLEKLRRLAAAAK